MVMYLLHLSKCSSSCCQMGLVRQESKYIALSVYKDMNCSSCGSEVYGHWQDAAITKSCNDHCDFSNKFWNLWRRDWPSDLSSGSNTTTFKTCQTSTTLQRAGYTAGRKKHQNCSRSSDCPTWFVCHDDTHNQLQKSVSVDQNMRMQLLCAIK